MFNSNNLAELLSILRKSIRDQIFLNVYSRQEIFSTNFKYYSILNGISCTLSMEFDALTFELDTQVVDNYVVNDFVKSYKVRMTDCNEI